MSFENLPSICVNSCFLGFEPAMICSPVFVSMNSPPRDSTTIRLKIPCQQCECVYLDNVLV